MNESRVHTYRYAVTCNRLDLRRVSRCQQRYFNGWISSGSRSRSWHQPCCRLIKFSYGVLGNREMTEHKAACVYIVHIASAAVLRRNRAYLRLPAANTDQLCNIDSHPSPLSPTAPRPSRYFLFFSRLRSIFFSISSSQLAGRVTIEISIGRLRYIVGFSNPGRGSTFDLSPRVAHISFYALLFGRTGI